MSEAINNTKLPNIEVVTLIKLLERDEFGISSVQRLHKCGYNFAAHMLTRWAEQGLVEQQPKGWVFKPLKQPIHLAAFNVGLATQMRHIHMPIKNLLQLPQSEFAEIVNHEDGLHAARCELERLFASGVEFLTFGNCDNREADGSCSGHYELKEPAQ